MTCAKIERTPAVTYRADGDLKADAHIIAFMRRNIDLREANEKRAAGLSTNFFSKPTADQQELISWAANKVAQTLKVNLELATNLFSTEQAVAYLEQIDRDPWITRNDISVKAESYGISFMAPHKLKGNPVTFVPLKKAVMKKITSVIWL